MANQNDSFIDEVTDELRRDRLFAAFRRYGWIALVLILALVGGAAWLEWRRASHEGVSQQFGDAVLAAEAANDPEALAAIDGFGSTRRAAIAQILAADRWTAAGDTMAASAALIRAAELAGEDAVLADMALLKRVMIGGTGLTATERDEMLTRLSRAGAPYELLALEQKAIALIGADRRDDAITLIRQIQTRDGLSQSLRLRLSEMMITMGVEPDPGDTMPAG